MKQKFLKVLLFTALGIGLGTSTTAANNASTTKKAMTPEILLSLIRISSPTLSPSGKMFLYSRTIPNIKENKLSSEVVLASIDGNTPSSIILSSDKKASQATFLSDNIIAYIGSNGGSRQLFTYNIATKVSQQISDFDFDVTGFLFSPGLNKVAIVREVALPNIAQDRNKDLDQITGKIYTDLMYKHWDEWVTSIPKPFIASVDPGSLKVSTELLPVLGEDEWYEAPTKPFSGVEDFSWSKDNRLFAYSCRKKTGLEYAVSTNTDIYLFDTETRQTSNLTEGMMGYDTNPTFSNDGTKIAWVSMERDGYESDIKRLFTYDFNTKEKKQHAPTFENHFEQFEWLPKDNVIRFISTIEALTNIYEIDLKNDEIKQITEGIHDVTSFSGNGNSFVASIQSLVHPTDIYRVDLRARGRGKKMIKTSQLTKLTDENDAVLENIEMAKVEKVWVPTTDGKKMLTWLVLPPFFNSSKKYPAILYCQGGPQNTVSQFWSYRWNLNTFASGGFVIVAPNRRGLPSFGKEWLEQISGDYGGQNMKDYLSAIDYAAELPYIDKDRLGCTGASYGGFSTYWLAGNHDKRFKAFFAHAGIFNLEAQYLETEEKFFANWDMGGAYWDKTNAIAQKTYATSPHKFVDKWDTPIFISHGERDFRILASQGMMAFDAARIKGIPTEMLIFPDENHWILQPQNGVLFYRSFLNWMDRWLKQ